MRSRIIVIALFCLTIISCRQDGGILSGGGSGNIASMDASKLAPIHHSADFEGVSEPAPPEKSRLEDGLRIGNVMQHAANRQSCITSLVVYYPENWTVLETDKRVASDGALDLDVLFSIEGERTRIITLDSVMTRRDGMCDEIPPMSIAVDLVPSLPASK